MAGNNDFYNCGTGLYYDDWATSVTALSTTITTGDDPDNSLLDRGNVAVNPMFNDEDGAGNNISYITDNDWSLSASSPASVIEGGLDLSVYFTDDKDGTSRTTPWSIGAYEY